MSDILEIKDGVLERCTDHCATSVTIPDGVKKIDHYAFCMCSVSSLEIPDGVTNIGPHAFHACGLESIKIPGSVKRIGEDAFYNCKWLSKVTLGDDFEKVPAGWFDSLEIANPNYEIICTKDSSTYNAVKRSPTLRTHIKEIAFQVAKDKKIAEVKNAGAAALIKTLLENLEDSSFDILSNAKSATVAMVQIGKNIGVFKRGTDSSKWFPKFQKLLEVFSDSTKSGADIFGVITSLKLPLGEIPGKKAEQMTLKGDSCCSLNLFASGVLRKINYSRLKDIALFGIKEIGKEAFKGSNIASVVIPDSVKEIGDKAFEGCNIDELSHPCLTIKNGVAIKDDEVLYLASQSESVAIPDGVTKIGEGAFCECGSLKSVSISPSVTEIGGNAFLGCSSLMSVEFGGTAAQWEAVEKGEGWHALVPATSVKCSDGEVVLPEE